MKSTGARSNVRPGLRRIARHTARRAAPGFPLVIAMLSCACTASVGALDVDGPMIETSVGVRASPHDTGTGLGLRAGIDARLFEGDRLWAGSADVLVPIHDPTYVLLGTGFGSGPVQWHLALGAGSQFSFRERERHWGVFAEGGGLLLKLADGHVHRGSLSYFARIGLYVCVRPLPC